MSAQMNSLAASLVAAASIAFAAPASGQTFPNRTVTIVVPYQPGAFTDSVGRLLATQFEKRLGSAVVVENRPGADGRIGSQYVARSPADGHTLLLASSALPTWSVFVKDAGIDPQKDLAPVVKLTEGAFILAASSKTPFNTLPEMIAYARVNPGKLNFATLGPGEIQLFLELIRVRAGVDIVHVPYKGAEQFTALIRGDVHMAMSAVGRMLAMHKDGQAKPLAATGSARPAEMPGVPTFAELGFEGFDNNWFAFFVPSATPRSIIARLNKASLESINEPAFVEACRKIGVQPLGSTPEELASMLDATMRKWRTIAQSVGITPQ
jgi:tripartite-type tricarboxylate transporter receptor subunit TctC